VLPDLVVTVFEDGDDVCAAMAGVAMRAATATDAINFFIRSSCPPALKRR
jgi:hypothetical protein